MQTKIASNRHFLKILTSLLLVSVFLSSPAVFAAGEKRLIPGGDLFGVELTLAGVLVTEYAPFEADGGEVSPARQAGLVPGDLICAANGREIQNAQMLSDLVSENADRPLSLSVLRRGEKTEVSVRARKSRGDGAYHLGIRVKDRMAGVGTLTYYDPAAGTFGGLGHGVCEPAAESLLPIRSGIVRGAGLEAIVRAKAGEPGELRAALGSSESGTVALNSDCGVFGTLSASAFSRTPLAVGTKEELTTGAAQILCTLDREGSAAYEAEITRICSTDARTKNFIVTVTDEKLLKKTGGIVQGMSGSPILQNGKLVGALTHVLVNHPTQGYGIFIENMLNAEQTLSDKEKIKNAS